MVDAIHLIDQCSEEDRARVLAAAWVVAFADGRLWREKGLLETIRRELDVPKEAAREIEGRTREGKQRVYVPHDLPARQVMFHYALKVAASDGRIDKRERRIAQRAGKALGLGTKEITSQLDRLTPSRTIRSRVRRRLAKQAPSNEQSEAKSEALRRFLVTIGGREAATTPFGSFLIAHQSAIVLVLANLVPVVGVLYFDWDVFLVVLLYWMENGAIGVFSVLRIALAQRFGRLAVLLIPFFAAHYGFFLLGHLAFICFLLKGSNVDVAMFATLAETFRSAGLFLFAALASLCIEHGHSFYREYWKTQTYKQADPVNEMFKPYGRVVVLHLAILFGALLMEKYGLPQLVVLLLLAFKIVYELVMLKVRETPRELLKQKGEQLFWMIFFPVFLGGIGAVIGAFASSGIALILRLFIPSIRPDNWLAYGAAGGGLLLGSVVFILEVYAPNRNQAQRSRRE